jgi:hypothetical protein
MGELTLTRADELSPETVRNQIVRDLAQLQTRGPRIDDVLPTLVLTDSEETYYRMDSGVMPMRQTALSAEAPIGGSQDLSKDQYSVDTFQKKRSPERGADFELNTDQDLLNAYNWAVNQLERELRITREIAGWQGLDDVDGFIGPDGETAHPALSSDNVLTPGTAFSDHGNSTPQDTFHTAWFRVENDGLMLDEMPQPTTYMSPSVLQDLKQNEDLENRFSGVEVQGLTAEQVEGVVPVPNIELVYTKTIRTNDKGQPVDENGDVVEERSEAAQDNILEPYDFGAGTNRRNIVYGTLGVPETASMPVLTDRLDNIVRRSGVDMMGEWAVDETMGFLTQSWANPDPAETWYKIAQEIGVEMIRPENVVVIQDI